MKVQHYHTEFGVCLECHGTNAEFTISNIADISHGQEIPINTFYFNNSQDKNHSFRELTERLIKLINSNEDFSVEIKKNSKAWGVDPYLQTR